MFFQSLHTFLGPPVISKKIALLSSFRESDSISGR